MTQNLLDFSLRPELAQHARVIADVQATAMTLGVPAMVAGAFARDLLIYYAHGIPSQRQTEDVDFAIAVSDWSVYANLKARLLERGKFRDVSGGQQRLRHENELLVDLVPFGGIETVSRHLDWPPAGEFRMDAFGFQEAFNGAKQVCLPDGVEVPIVSLPALALLKLVAWQDRHYRALIKWYAQSSCSPAWLPRHWLMRSRPSQNVFVQRVASRAEVGILPIVRKGQNQYQRKNSTEFSVDRNRLVAEA